MNTHFGNGRREAVALASMNLRAVVGATAVTYLSVPERKFWSMGSRGRACFLPRDEQGQFVPNTELWEAVNREYAMTAFEFDVEDEGGWPDFFSENDDVDSTDDLFTCDDINCPNCRS